MDADETRKRILECARQQGKDVSPERILVAVPKPSGYNVSSYSDFLDAEKHALKVAISQGSDTNPIIIMALDSRLKGFWKAKAVDGKLDLELVEYASNSPSIQISN